MGPSGCFTHVGIILDCLGQVNADFIQVLYLGRAPRTKETLPDFLKWGRVTRYPLVFRGLTGSQRTLGFWGVTITLTFINVKSIKYLLSRRIMCVVAQSTKHTSPPFILRSITHGFQIKLINIIDNINSNVIDLITK